MFNFHILIYNKTFYIYFSHLIDHFTLVVCKCLEQIIFCEQDYLEESCCLSSEAVRMLGDLLNQDSIMSKALTEMIYLENDVSDNVK